MNTRTRSGTGRGKAIAAQPSGSDLVKALLGAVAQMGKEGQHDRAHMDTQVKHEGREIVLPADPVHMAIPDAIEVLTTMHEEQEQEVAINEVIRGAHYADGQVAFTDAMEEVFGWTQAVPVKTFFGTILPKFVDVPIGLNQSRRIVTGRFNMPNVPGHVETAAEYDGQSGMYVLKIVGVTIRKFQPLYEALAEATRRRVRENSIFKNKAFELLFAEDGKISSESPTFVDVSGAETPIFSRQTEKAIQANILTIIQQTDRVRKMGTPIKRGILLEGPYGTGKTLVSRQTGQTCLENGWTFIVIRKSENLAPAISFARRFQPACVFVEDIDREMGGEDRDNAMDEILNTLDGVDSKNAEVMVVLTSNHADTINRAMLRPGRLDAVITIDAPDAEAALRLANVYAKGLLDPDADYTDVGDALAGHPAAVIREVVERAKLYAIGEIPAGDKFFLTPSSLTDSAATMERQLALLQPKDEEPKDAGTKFIEAVADTVVHRLSLADVEGGEGSSAIIAGVVAARRAAEGAQEAAESAEEAVTTVGAGGEKTQRQIAEIHRAVT